MNHGHRRMRSAMLALASACIVLALAACQGVTGTPGGEETVAVLIAPSFAEEDLSSQGLPGAVALGDIEIDGVVLFVRVASAGDSTHDECVVFAGDGTVLGRTDASDPDSYLGVPSACLRSMWSGSSVVPQTLHLPPLGPDGNPITYEFLLNVRSRGVSAAFASETVSELTTPTTLYFRNLVSFLASAEFVTVDPYLVTETCTSRDTAVEVGDVVTLHLYSKSFFGVSTGSCPSETNEIRSFPVPFSDLGIGIANVKLGTVDVTSTALLDSSKRGLRIQVPSSATPGQAIEVTLSVNGQTSVRAIPASTTALAVGAQARIASATIALHVTEPPVSVGVEPDLTRPRIDFARANLSLTEALLAIGPSSDPADVADVVAFLGVQQIALETKTVFADSNANGAYVNYQAYVCSDFARFFPTGGATGTDLELTFFAVDPTGNQSAPFAVPITVNTLYSGPSENCTSTSPL